MLLGPENATLAEDLDRLAGVYIAEKKFQPAEALLQRSLAIMEKEFGPRHRAVARHLVAYADLLRKMNRVPEAVALESRAKDIDSQQKQ